MKAGLLRPQYLLPGCILLIYLAWLTKTYYWDGVLFSLNIESVHDGRAPVLALFHPNHLVYNAFGYGVYRIALALLPGVRAITVLQIANVLLSVATGYIIFLIAHRATSNNAAALFCWVVFAAGATWWKFSTDADTYVVSVLLVTLCAWMLLRRHPLLWPAALCHATAMLFHELAVFMYVPIFVFLWRGSHKSTVTRIRTAMAYGVVTGGIVALAYWLCYEQADHSRYPTLLSWITSFASDSSFAQSFADVFRYYPLSYLKLFAGGKANLIQQFFSPAEAIGFMLCAAFLGWAIRNFKRSAPKPRTATVDKNATLFVWAWLISYAVFFAVWDPGSAFHKLFVWPALVLLIGVYVSRTQHVQAYTAIAGALAAWNFAAFIYPHSRPAADPVLVLAERVNAELPRDATVYYRVLSPDDWYLEYFAPERMWRHVPVPAHIRGPVCLETTALEGFNGPIDQTRKWDLVNSAHNIRLECLAAPER